MCLLSSAFDSQYLAVSVTGYAALGNSAPSNILLGFEGAPVAVTILANLMVLTHMLSAYQVPKHLMCVGVSLTL